LVEGLIELNDFIRELLYECRCLSVILKGLEVLKENEHWTNDFLIIDFSKDFVYLPVED
jgi:hypothetical protein